MNKNSQVILIFAFFYKKKKGEDISRKGKGKGILMDNMNQTKGFCVHIWKCHNESPGQLLYTIFLKRGADFLRL
jgi:hypothetical protein